MTDEMAVDLSSDERLLLERLHVLRDVKGHYGDWRKGFDILYSAQLTFRLSRKGLIEKPGFKWVLTDAGREALKENHEQSK
jgi:hypothetical protein